MIFENYESTKRKIKKIFWAVSKDKPESEVLQGIIYSDGSISIGYDAWRLMNRMDYPSYSVESFDSVRAVQSVYQFVRIRCPYYYLKDCAASHRSIAHKERS